MSRASDVIEKVMFASVLLPEMLVVPRSGAADAAIRREEARLPRPLSNAHRAILERWNGLNIDVLRIYGCEGTDEREIGLLSRGQVPGLDRIDGAIVFGSDPAGFLFAEGADGTVYSIDTDSGAIKQLATDIDDFFERVVFGRDAADFGGDEWRLELEDAGLI